ncbi:MAG: mannose-6-phosphate isomerase [Acidobacteria bacterium]|nr:mannose-6-phosphate isomerase [Acidobacteriota bacterium]
MAEHSKLITRPWGRYREYARNQQCTVWMVEMNAGESGSLQSHEHFDELWVMSTDGGVVQVGNRVLHPRAFEEIFIPRGTKHRLSNEHGSGPLRMFEVAYGEVRDEDKVRYEDRYGRT